MESEQKDEKSGLLEVDLGRFDEPLAPVEVIGFEEENLLAGFQNRNPGLGGANGDADIPCQFAKDAKLPGPKCHSSQEAVEVPKASDVAQGPYIPLQIGSKVGGEP